MSMNWPVRDLLRLDFLYNNSIALRGHTNDASLAVVVQRLPLSSREIMKKVKS